jgi:hypothetical protein
MKIESGERSNMAFANLKHQDEQTSQELARAFIEIYPNKSGEFISSKQIRVLKGQYLDVDGVLARSFKNVKAISLARTNQSFEQGKAT